MNVITNVNVSYNVGLTGTTSGLIEGRVLRKNFLENGGIRVTYKYLQNGIEFQHKHFDVAPEVVEGLYSVIKSGLPSPDDGFTTYIDTVFYEAMKVQMVNTFSDLTGTTQIDLIA